MIILNAFSIKIRQNNVARTFTKCQLDFLKQACSLKTDRFVRCLTFQALFWSRAQQRKCRGLMYVQTFMNCEYLNMNFPQMGGCILTRKSSYTVPRVIAINACFIVNSSFTNIFCSTFALCVRSFYTFTWWFFFIFCEK